MELTIEEKDNKNIISVAGISIELSLVDIENILTHLEYYKNNDSIQKISIKIGGKK